MTNRATCVFAAPFLLAALLCAQEFRVDSRLVLVPVTVVDSRGANIRGLPKESFSVLEDGHPQPIAAFYTEDAPCTIGLVLDASGSLQKWLLREKESVRAFLDLSNPGDDYFVTTISSSPAVLASGSDVREIESRISGIQAEGWTALNDGIRFAAEQVRRGRRGCRALFVISDGVDNHSQIAKQELMRFLVEADVQVFSIAIGETWAGRKGVQLIEDQRGIAFLSDLAEKTGGFSIRVRDNNDPADAARRIARALRDRYIIGFQPSGATDSAKWHRIQVRTDRNRVTVYARSGYRASAALE
jgi:Ca-activated chloride channel family protein